MLIIPNMEMPKCCDDCPCLYDGYCMALQPSKNMGTGIDYDTMSKKRMDWCPLIEKKPGIRFLKEQ